jgi:ATP-dependent protease HslVU (ClpYQ) peptidase subunit
MTTIAYRDGVLAVDGRATRDNIVVEHRAKKVVRLESGDVIAFAGSLSKFEPFVEWYQDRSKERPNLGNAEGGTATAIVMTSDRILEFCAGGVSEIVEPYCAWGSGTPAAMAAMVMGADARQAVLIASQVDIWTGGEIVAMERARKD